MELQGKKAAHDFLSLYSPDSSFQLQDPRSSSQGFFLKTQDFLQPLERGEKDERRTGEAAAGAGSAPVERVLPGGVGTFSDSHAGARGGVEKAEAVQANLAGFEAKAEHDHGSRSSTTSYGSYAGGASPYTLWDDKDTASRGQWPSPFAAARHNSTAPEKKRLMEAAASRSSLGYNDADEVEEVFGKREGSSSSRKDFSIKVDGKASSADQRPNTPRTKHSATEQRRRSKINDRFQILRETIPHSDQKRDKASFLLEVIEYIRFLKEKVQKYESAHPTWNQNNAKLMPWQNNGQALANGLSTPFQVIKDEPAPPPTHVFSKKFDEDSTQVAAPVLSTVHSFPAAGVTAGNTYEPMETATSIASNLAAAAAASTPNLSQPRLFTVGRESSIAQPQQRLIKNPDNTAFQDRSPWLRSCSVAGNAVGREVLGEQEELTINEGTINVSTAYSHGVLSALTQALQSSGVDLSQARISVQINLGKGAINKKPSDTATTSTVKDLKDPASIYQAIGYSRLESGGEVLSQALKRRKAENS